MNKPDKRITNFFNKHHVFNLATSIENKSWCCSCFYTIIEDEMAIVFTSDKDTRHAKEFMQNTNVSGSIHLETLIIGRIKGVQFSGTIVSADANRSELARKTYLKRFPFAALMNTTLWILNIDYIKMADNKFGFGKKLTWERDEK